MFNPFKRNRALTIDMALYWYNLGKADGRRELQEELDRPSWPPPPKWHMSARYKAQHAAFRRNMSEDTKEVSIVRKIVILKRHEQNKLT